LLAAQLADARFTATLLGVFAGLALVLAVVGLFGVVSYEVAQRTRELGIRIALGAPPGGVVGLVVRQELVATTVGLVAGAVLGVSASGVLRPLLYKTPPADPLTILSVAGVLCLGALLGCYLPARRAT